MSFILDALRRADSERERGRVPGLHAQTLGGATDGGLDGSRAHRAGRGWARWLVMAVSALALVLLGAWASSWLSSPAPPTRVAALPTLPVPAPAARSGPELVQVQPPPLAAVLPTVAPGASAPLKEPAVPLLSELPPELRSQIPTLSSGGAMYSDTPANRMLILNGQLLHEGDLVGGKLLLEEIRLNGAVLSLQGRKFRIGY